MSAGGVMLRLWNRTVHGDGTDRAAWGRRVAELLERHGVDAELPPYPTKRRTTQADRDATVRRVYARAELEPWQLWRELSPAQRTYLERLARVERDDRRGLPGAGALFLVGRFERTARVLDDLGLVAITPARTLGGFEQLVRLTDDGRALVAAAHPRAVAR